MKVSHFLNLSQVVNYANTPEMWSAWLQCMALWAPELKS